MDEFASSVFEVLVKILPSDWGKIILHTSIEEKSQSMYFFVQDKDSHKYYSFMDLIKMGIFSKQEFQKVSTQTGTLSREYQDSFEKKWTAYTLEILRDGNVNIDFDYDRQPTADFERWKEKYLK